MQQVVDDAPPAKHYFSDGSPTYAQLLCIRERARWQRARARRIVSRGGNAELRHYLARLDLARFGRRSRCFSRCIWALQRAVALFVCAWHKRQRFKRAFPKAPAHVRDFVADLIQTLFNKREETSMASTLTLEVETVVEEQARRQIVQQQGRAAAASKEDARPCQKKMLYLVTGFFYMQSPCPQTGGRILA